MRLTHSSFSSGVGAEMRYTVWLPSTTRPSASVLQALMTWSLLSGMYSSKQFWNQSGGLSDAEHAGTTSPRASTRTPTGRVCPWGSEGPVWTLRLRLRLTRPLGRPPDQQLYGRRDEGGASSKATTREARRSRQASDRVPLPQGGTTTMDGLFFRPLSATH